MEQLLIVILGTVLSILSAIHIFILSDLKKEIRSNREEFYEKISRLIDTAEKRNEYINRQLDEQCKLLNEHGAILVKHNTLLQLDYTTRSKIFEGQKNNKQNV